VVSTSGRRGAKATLAVLALLAGCYAAHAQPAAESGTRPRGSPLLVAGVAYGTTSSGGPHCRRPYADDVYDLGCGVFYAIDRQGAYSERYAFRDVRQGVPVGKLFAGPDGWLYGGTTSAPPIVDAEIGARPVVFRIKPDGSGFQVVHKFDGPDNILMVAVGSVDRKGTVYALAVWTNGTIQGQSRFYRVEHGRATILADFPDQFSVGAPTALADSSLASILWDPGACSATGIITSATVHELFRLNSGEMRDGRCYADGIPFSSPVASGTDLFALNELQLIRITADGTRTVVARLTPALGHFVGAPVRDSSGNTLALAADVRSTVCLRLLRIDVRGDVHVVRKFKRSNHRCLSDGDQVVPRLETSPGGDVVFATEEDGCAKQLSSSAKTSQGPSCGSIVGIRRDGSIAFVHDFAQAPPVTDFGAPSVRYTVSGRGRTLHVSLVRSPPGPEPFQIDFGLLGMRLIGSDSRVITISGNGAPASHRDTVKDDVLTYANADVVEASFRLPASLPADMYNVRIDANGAVQNGKREQLAITPGISTVPVYVPALLSDDVQIMRQRYVGKTLGGWGYCRDTEGNLAFLQSSTAQVVDVRRTDGDELSANMPLGFAGLFIFRSVDPVVFTMTGLTVNSQQVVNAPADKHDSDHFACPKFTMTVADAWQADRAFNPPLVSPLWPSHFQRSIRDHKPVVGMTPEMVVAAWGYPSAFGTLAQLKKLDRWDYNEPGPFGHGVIFRRGRVISVALPGNLP